MTTKQSAPSIPAARRAIALEVFARLAARYEEVKRRNEELAERTGGDEEVELWTDLAFEELEDASRQLTRAIIAWLRADEGYIFRSEMRKFSPMAVVQGGRVYAIRAHPRVDHWEMGRESSDPDVVMELSVIDRASYADFDGEVADLDEPADEEDDQAEADEDLDEGVLLPANLPEAKPEDPEPESYDDPASYLPVGAKRWPAEMVDELFEFRESSDAWVEAMEGVIDDVQRRFKGEDDAVRLAHVDPWVRMRDLAEMIQERVEEACVIAVQTLARADLKTPRELERLGVDFLACAVVADNGCIYVAAPVEEASEGRLVVIKGQGRLVETRPLCWPNHDGWPNDNADDD